jgi:hypothetical protein
MTLALTNEAIRRENWAEKKLYKEKKMPQGSGWSCKMQGQYYYKIAQDFVRTGERGIEVMVLTYLLLIYRISSDKGFTLGRLSCFVLVPH